MLFHKITFLQMIKTTMLVSAAEATWGAEAGVQLMKANEAVKFA